MSREFAVVPIAIALFATGCSGSNAVDTGKGGAVRVALEGTTYEVRDVAMTIEMGEGAYWRLR